MNDAITLFDKKCDLKVSRKDILFCYGMSKQTVCGENYDNESKHYNRMTPSEFYEMIGRIAQIKFQASELEELHLSKKIEFVIDEMVGLVPGLQRQEVKADQQFEETESDSDY